MKIIRYSYVLRHKFLISVTDFQTLFQCGKEKWIFEVSIKKPLGQTLGDSEGQGSPACCSPWGPKESDTTE